MLKKFVTQEGKSQTVFFDNRALRMYWFKNDLLIYWDNTEVNFLPHNSWLLQLFGPNFLHHLHSIL